jgi:hypothetical protein
MRARRKKPQVPWTIARAQIGAGALRQRAPFLVIPKLETGDVIVLRGKKPRSKVIAGFTGGSYSHAALWVGHGCLVESDGAGVGETFPQLLSLSRGNGREVICLPAEEPVSELVVLRHPGMASVSEKARADALARLRQREFYSDYSELARLPKLAVRAPAVLRRVAERTFGKFDGLVAPNRAPGAFCSELVAIYFEVLGLPLFPGIVAGALSPNSLVTNSKWLIEDAVLHPRDIPDGAAAWYAPFGLMPSRRSWLRPRVMSQRLLRRLKETVGAFERRVSSLRARERAIAAEAATARAAARAGSLERILRIIQASQGLIASSGYVRGMAWVNRRIEEARNLDCRIREFDGAPGGATSDGASTIDEIAARANLELALLTSLACAEYKAGRTFYLIWRNAITAPLLDGRQVDRLALLAALLELRRNAREARKAMNDGAEQLALKTAAIRIWYARVTSAGEAASLITASSAGDGGR